MNGVKPGLLFTAAATIRVYSREPNGVYTHSPLANPALRFSAPVTLNIEVAVFATLN